MLMSDQKACKVNSIGLVKDGAVSDESVPLGDALSRQAKPEHWETYVTEIPSTASALIELSTDDPGLLAFYRNKAARSNGPAAPPKGQADNRRRLLGAEILAAFKTALCRQLLFATGFQPPSTDRKTVPAALWRQLVINFEDSSARFDAYKFIAIEVSPAPHTPDTWTCPVSVDSF